MRKISLLEAHVRMLLVHRVETDEGDVIPYHRTDLECGKELDGTDDRVKGENIPVLYSTGQYSSVLPLDSFRRF